MGEPRGKPLNAVPPIKIPTSNRSGIESRPSGREAEQLSTLCILLGIKIIVSLLFWLLQGNYHLAQNQATDGIHLSTNVLKQVRYNSKSYINSKYLHRSAVFVISGRDTKCNIPYWCHPPHCFQGGNYSLNNQTSNVNFLKFSLKHFFYWKQVAIELKVRVSNRSISYCLRADVSTYILQKIANLIYL